MIRTEAERVAEDVANRLLGTVTFRKGDIVSLDSNGRLIHGTSGEEPLCIVADGHSGKYTMLEIKRGNEWSAYRVSIREAVFTDD